MQIVNDKFIENVEQCMHKLQMDCLKDVGLKLSHFCYTVCNQDNVAQVINARCGTSTCFSSHFRLRV